MAAAFVTASVVAYNNWDEISQLLASIDNNVDTNDFLMTIVDNASTEDAGVNICDHYPWVRSVRLSDNRGFGAGHNHAIMEAQSKFHFIVNPDILLVDDAFKTLATFLDCEPDIALATCKVLNPDGTIQKLPVRRPAFRYLLARRLAPSSQLAIEYITPEHGDGKIVDVGFCSGCFMAARTEYLHRLGGFDESFFMYFEDADLTNRAAMLGRTVRYSDCAVIHNWQGGSRKSSKLLWLHIKSMMHYFSKYQ